MERINAILAQKDTPRPHHLRGDAFYQQEDGVFMLKATVFFSTEHPSIGDRVDKYLPWPHVNFAEVQYATWNAGHIIGDKQHYVNRAMKASDQRAYGIIPPDTNLDIEVRVEPTLIRGSHVQGEIESQLYQKGKLLSELKGEYRANIRK